MEELGEFLDTIGEKKFRARQLYSWLMKGTKSFAQMTNLPLALRETLSKLEAEGEIAINCAEIKDILVSHSSATRKYLFSLLDGNCVESVFMKYKYGNSICISSQAGCRMGCAFCASTANGLGRNLTAGEMIEQIICVSRDTGERINHVVVMGTGEPFDNYENLAKFLELARNPEGLGIGGRNITVSTCGIIPKIEAFAKDFPSVGLAISLHAPNNHLRDMLMPINKAYPIEPLLAACKNYVEVTGRRVTFEYALIKGINDSLKQADELANLLHRQMKRLCHVNLIPLNSVTESRFKGSGRKAADAFCQRLLKHNIPATVRKELGSDIDAACGQLRLNSTTVEN